MRKLQYLVEAVPAVKRYKGRIDNKFPQEKNNNYELWPKTRSALLGKKPQRDRRQRLRRRSVLGIAADGY